MDSNALVAGHDELGGAEGLAFQSGTEDGVTGEHRSERSRVSPGRFGHVVEVDLQSVAFRPDAKTDSLALVGCRLFLPTAYRKRKINLCRGMIALQACVIDGIGVVILVEEPVDSRKRAPTVLADTRL